MEAEALRLRLHLKRAATRAVLVSIAVALLLGALAFGHIAAWYWLREYLAAKYVGLIFAGIDLLLALVLALLAAWCRPGEAELEALALRRRALDDATDFSALLLRLADYAILSWNRK
jgi:hypothetical protein